MSSIATAGQQRGEQVATSVEFSVRPVSRRYASKAAIGIDRLAGIRLFADSFSAPSLFLFVLDPARNGMRRPTSAIAVADQRTPGIKAGFRTRFSRVITPAGAIKASCAALLEYPRLSELRPNLLAHGLVLQLALDERLCGNSLRVQLAFLQRLALR